MSYSIWIIPPEPVYRHLSKVIRDLADQYKGPTFKPHLTLLGEVDLELNNVNKAVNEAIASMYPLSLSLGPISFSTTYFQSVFVRVNSTASLMQLNLDLKKRLNIKNGVFMPHISLIYGNHSMKTRERIASKVKSTHEAFMANKIAIIPATPEPSEWKPIALIPFGSKH